MQGETLELAANLDQTRVPAHAQTQVKLHLTLSPSLSLTAKGRMQTHICLLFDCSASMMGKKLETTIAAAKRIVDLLAAPQRISLVAFETRCHTLINGACLADTEKDRIRREIDRLRSLPNGSTNLTDALRRATFLMGAHPADARVIIILSDGMADMPQRAEAAAREATEAGIELFGVGIGELYDAAHLLALVTPSNGAVFGEAELEDLERTFSDLIRRLDRFVATEARLEIQLGPGVEAGSVYKTDPERAFINDAKPVDGRLKLQVGNIEAAQRYGFLVLATVPARQPGAFQLGRVSLTYDVPSCGARGERHELPLSIIYDAAPGNDDATEPDTEVCRAFESARVAELTHHLAEARRKGQHRRMSQYAEQLQHQWKRLGNAEMAGHCGELLQTLKRGGLISNRMMNRSLEASVACRDPRDAVRIIDVVALTDLTPRQSDAARGPFAVDAQPAAPAALEKERPDTDLFDVVLEESGATRIRLVREIRDATGADLRSVNRMVESVPSTIEQTLDHEAAIALQQRIAAAGGRAAIRRHADHPGPV